MRLQDAYANEPDNQSFNYKAQEYIQKAQQGPLANHLDWWIDSKILNEANSGAIHSYSLFSHSYPRTASALNQGNENQNDIDKPNKNNP